MQPTIVKTSKSELCLVVVPDDAINIEDHLTYVTFHTGMGTDDYDILRRPLPEGNWQLIGPLKDITEEQAMKIADKDPVIGYTNYQFEYRSFLSAQNSLKSLAEFLSLTGNVIILKRTV